MSQSITEAFVQQYRNNIFHLSQQKGSRLRNAVRVEMMKGKFSFFDRLGAVEATQGVGRHEDTQYQDTPHSRRRVALVDYRRADLIDDEDLIRTLIDPKNSYAMAQWWAMGRAMDNEIVAAMRGNAYAGESGNTVVALPESQMLLAATEAAPGTPTSLNVDTLRAIKRKFGANDVDQSIKLHIALTSNEEYALLGQTQVTSSDYAAVKALVHGEVDEFMGFKFHRIESLPKESGKYNNVTGVVGAAEATTLTNARRILAWAEDGVILGIGRDIEAKIDVMPNKNYSTQVFSRMSIGATRLEDVKVVEVLVKP